MDKNSSVIFFITFHFNKLLSLIRKTKIIANVLYTNKHQGKIPSFILESLL